MKIAIIGIVVLVLFFIKAKADKKKYTERIQNLLEEEWGIYTRDEYSEKILENIRHYYEKNKGSQTIDDITWNDLNMDEVYKVINHTRTSAGEEMLYSILRSPVYEEGILKEREQVIRSLQNNAHQRKKLEFALYDIGKTDRISVYRYLYQTEKIKELSCAIHYILCLALLSGIGLLFTANPMAILAVCLLVFFNAYFYYKQKATIIEHMAVFEFVLSTIHQCRDISKIQVDGCEKYILRLHDLAKKFERYSRFHFLVSGGNTMSGSIFDAVFDYVRILFHVDLIKISTMIREVKKHREELLEIYEIIGFLDSMLAIASYRSGAMNYCVPKLIVGENGEKELAMEEGYHPLIKNPVRNSIHATKGVLLTGSNASGKSTFLKTVAINAIFAQTLHTVLADSYTANYFRIYSSMALRDDIMSQESYFIVEIKSLHRIFEQFSKTSVPVLCFVDEILRGTNTVERVAASSQLLEEMGREAVLCFAATHDIELTYLLENRFENYHFQETVQEHDILFDYSLRKGRANSKNAIKLLKLIGFSEDTIAKAQQRADYFLREGKWSENDVKC